MLICKEYKSFESLENFKETWDNFVLARCSPVYMTFDWCQIWWSFYGKKKELSIFLFYEDDRLVGIIPLYFDRVYSGHLNLKVCKLVGANLPPKVFNPPIQSEYKSDVLVHCLQNILQDRCDLVSLGPVSECFYPDDVLNYFNSKLPSSLNIRTDYEPYSIFELPESFEEYLDSINPAERKDFKYNYRRLNRDYNFSIEVCKNFDEKDFNNFMEMHRLQWQKQGKLGHFNSWPDGKVFNITLAKKLAEKGRYLLIKLLKNNEVICYDYGYKLGKNFYGQLFARSVLAENKKFSLGTLGMVLLVKTMLEEKVKFIEAGLGYYDYKLKLGAKLYKTFIYRFLADKKSSLIKYQMLEMEKKIGGLLFHKLWYRRIQPSLPALFKTPISSRSIKLDY